MLFVNATEGIALREVILSFLFVLVILFLFLYINSKVYKDLH